MKPSRVILPSDTRMIYFGTKDVLDNHQEKEERKTKLNKAVQSTQAPKRIILRLPNGETVETQSESLNYYQDRDDIVVINGGHAIPIYAILDLES